MYDVKPKIDPRVDPDTYALTGWYGRAAAGALLFALMMLFSSCTTKTQYGECVGVGDKQDPKLEYQLDKTNVLLGLVFVETVWVPAVVVLYELYCPVERK